MAGDSGTYEAVSRYLKDRDEPCFPGSGREGSGGGGQQGKDEDDEEEEEERSGRKVVAAAASPGDPSAASGYELIDGTLYRKRLERGATSYTEVLLAAAGEQRRAVIAAFHQQPAAGQRHCTMEETYKNVSENYWWEGMFPDIRDYVQECNQCKDGRDNPLISEEKHITRELSTHCTKVLERLNSQRSKGLFCDVTLIVEKTSYPAHRAVLAAVSEYFQDLFSEKGSTSNKVVDLKGFSSKSFLPLLEFSYTSSLSLKPDYFAETSALARHLRIWEVVEMCAALYKLHGTENSKAHKEEGSKEEKNEFSSFEVFIDQSLTGPRQHVSDICYKFGQLEDGTTQQKLDNFDRNAFTARPHSAVIQGEAKVSDFTVKLQEMQAGLFKDKMTPVHSETCSVDNLGVETLESPSKQFKLLGFYDKTPSKIFSKVKSHPQQRCPSATKALGNIPNSLDLKFADMSRNASHQRKCSFEKTPGKSKPHTRVSKHLDHNIVGTQDKSGCKGVSTLLRSPVRQTATEEELYSPNTTEKYKLLSVLGLRRKTSVTDGEEQAGWKQKRRLRQPKIKNYSLLTGTKERKIDIAKTQLQEDQVKPKALANCFVVIEKILPPIQKQKGDNQKLNKKLLALNKSEPLSHNNVSQGHTEKEIVYIPPKTQTNNPKAKTKGRISCHDKIRPGNKCKGSSSRNGPSTAKSQQCKINASISTKGLKNGKKFSVISAEQKAVLSKTQASDNKDTEYTLTKKSRRCATYICLKSSSLSGSMTSKLSPCLTDHGHSGRWKTRQSYDSTVNYRKCKLMNMDHKMPSCPQNATVKRCMSKRTLPRHCLSLDNHNFHQTPKPIFSDDTCVALPSKNDERQVLDENPLNQLSAKAGVINVRKFKGKREGKKPVSNFYQNTYGARNEQKATTRLDRKPVGNDQPNQSHLRSKQETKNQEHLKTAFKNSGKQTLISRSKTQQTRRKVKITGCRSLDAGNQNLSAFLHSLQTDGSISVLGKRKRIPTQKLIEAGFSFGFFMFPQCKEKIDRPPDSANRKKFDLSPSRTLKDNRATKAKVVVKGNSKMATSDKRALVNRRQNCYTTEPSCRRKSSCSEISKRMKGSAAAKMKKIKPVGLYGKKLINLNIKSTLGNKRTRCRDAHVNTIKKDTQLSTSQKAVTLQRVASASLKLIGSKDLPKNLRGAAQILKKVKPKVNEVLKLMRRKSITGEKVKKTKASESHTCHECSTTFTNCDSLFVHRVRHIKGKHWPCLLCDKSFFRQKNVLVHLRCHSEKLYRCKQCMTESKKIKSFQSKR